MLLVFRTAAVFFVCDGERLERGIGGVSRARGEGHTQSPPAPPPSPSLHGEWCPRPDASLSGGGVSMLRLFAPRRPLSQMSTRRTCAPWCFFVP